MALPITIAAGDGGHLGDHEEVHGLLDDLNPLYVVTRYLQDTLANRPAAGRAGTFFHATDTLNDYLDDGTTWRIINGLITSAPSLDIDLITDTVASLKVPACRVGRTTNRSIASTSSFSSGIEWDDESGTQLYDNDAIHSTASNTERLVATRDGFWHAGTNIDWAISALGLRGVRLQKYPADVTLCATDRQSSGDIDNQNISADCELEVGDWVQVEVFQTSGAPVNVMAGVSFAWMHFISDE